MGKTFMTERQYHRAQALGLDVDSETVDIELNNTEALVYSRAAETRRAVRIRIQNISAQPVLWSENLAACNANQRNGIIPAATSAAAGDGGIIEFQGHIPRIIRVFCAAGATVIVTKRYADEN